jgi:phage repressor protein C with HTH and peptisase S24 domain
VENNSDVNSDVWFSADDLAALMLPGYPRSGRRFHDRAKAEGWRSREVPSSGRTGMRVEYCPPREVMALIEARRHGGMPPLRGGDVVESKAALYSAQPEAEYGADSSVFVDKYVNVRGSAGPGADVHDEAVVKVRMDARLLRERIGNGFSNIKIASVSGDSMEPTLSHGDQVLIDTSCERFIDDAIYAIQQDGHLRFKRIKKRLDGSIIVKSDNSPEVETYTAEEASRFFVVGIVIPFKFGRFKI